MTSPRKNPVRIQLTDEQKQQIREVTGKDANAIEFEMEELEDRIAPRSIAPGGPNPVRLQ